MGRIQTGYIYESSGAFFVRYYVSEIVDGEPQRVQRSHRLCEKSEKYYARNAKSVKLLRNEFMQTINVQQASGRTAAKDTLITDFWEQKYLPYCDATDEKTKLEQKYKGKGMKPSTVRGFKQIWNQHLKAHFAKFTLQGYQPDYARRFLASLKTSQGKNTLKHIRALASAMFSEAIERGFRNEANPWHVKLPKDCKESQTTKHYTLEEAENIISALVDHVDCQLMMALSCFLALRPGEIAALKWEDFDSENVHIRRSVVRGIVDTPKTLESVASLPLINQVRVPLKLWRQKSKNPKEGWVFPSRNNTPADLHNYIARIIKPHVEGKTYCERCDKTPKKSGVEWKTLYAGRRGACTAVIENTGGNYAVAQALLRHKSMTTTLGVYKKAITPEAFKSGMKLLEAAASK
jgi:integrase